MAVRTLTGARFDMTATLLHQGDPVPNSPSDVNLDDYGTWVEQQDPLTGEIVRVWQPYDNPNTPENEDVHHIGTIKCLARGIVDGGIRVAGTTEWFGADYRNIDFVKMWVPPNVLITKRDRITNIADHRGHIRWLDEEYDRDPFDNLAPKATVFNVNGVTPLFNAFNRIVEQFVLLERAEV